MYLLSITVLGAMCAFDDNRLCFKFIDHACTNVDPNARQKIVFSAMARTTHPLPHPTSRNENESAKSIDFKNLFTVLECPFSIDRCFPFNAHVSKKSPIL